MGFYYELTLSIRKVGIHFMGATVPVVAALAFISFAVNLPMGMWRARVIKFSWQWFVAIHISVPFIIYLRLEANVSNAFIPIMIFAAVIGQFAGGKFIINKKTKEDSA